MRTVALALIAGCIAAAPRADATLIRFTFTGNITSLEGPVAPPPDVVVGAQYTFTYVFNSNTPDDDPAPIFGSYRAIVEARIAIGAFGTGSSAGTITVLDGGFAGDSYGASIEHPIDSAVVGLTDFNFTAFDSDALPLDLRLSDFESRQFTLERSVGPTFWRAIGSVREFQSERVPLECDLNQDGAVDFGDVFLLIDIVGGIATCPPAIDCDLNQDGATDFGDVFFLIDVVGGLRPCS